MSSPIGRRLNERFAKMRKPEMARLFADENFDNRVVAILRKFGHDVVSVQDRGLGGLKTSDEIVLERAIAEERAILTENRRDFVRLHISNSEHFGIITTTRDGDFAALSQRIDDAINNVGNLRNQLIRINRLP